MAIVKMALVTRYIIYRWRMLELRMAICAAMLFRACEKQLPIVYGMIVLRRHPRRWALKISFHESGDYASRLFLAGDKALLLFGAASMIRRSCPLASGVICSRHDAAFSMRRKVIELIWYRRLLISAGLPSMLMPGAFRWREMVMEIGASGYASATRRILSMQH